MYDDSYQVIDPSQVGAETAFGLFVWFAIIAVYLYFAYMMSRIAYRCGCGEQRWWAFVPILNTLLLIKMAEKPMWWFFILLVPFVNVIAFFMLWMTAAKNAGQSKIWGFLALIPLIQFVAFFVLAFNGKKYEYPAAPSHPSQSGGGNKPPQSTEPTFPREPQNVE